MVRERGSGVTPARVVELLKNEVSAKSMLAVSNATGLGLAAIGRYLKGVGEPTTASLEKLADYFGVSVSYLRGGAEGPTERLLEGLKKAGIASAEFQEKMFLYMFDFEDLWLALLRGNFTQYMINIACEEFGLDSIWVQKGDVLSLDFNKVEAEGTCAMTGKCSRCGGEVTILLDRGKNAESSLIVTINPCKTCCHK